MKEINKKLFLYFLFLLLPLLIFYLSKEKWDWNREYLIKWGEYFIFYFPFTWIFFFILKETTTVHEKYPFDPKVKKVWTTQNLIKYTNYLKILFYSFPVLLVLVIGELFFVFRNGYQVTWYLIVCYMMSLFYVYQYFIQVLKRMNELITILKNQKTDGNPNS